MVRRGFTMYHNAPRYELRPMDDQRAGGKRGRSRNTVWRRDIQWNPLLHADTTLEGAKRPKRRRRDRETEQGTERVIYTQGEVKEKQMEKLPGNRFIYQSYYSWWLTTLVENSWNYGTNMLGFSTTISTQTPVSARIYCTVKSPWFWIVRFWCSPSRLSNCCISNRMTSTVVQTKGF